MLLVHSKDVQKPESYTMTYGTKLLKSHWFLTKKDSNAIVGVSCSESAAGHSTRPERSESNTLDNQIRFMAGDRFSIPAIRGDRLLAMVFLLPFCFIARTDFLSRIEALAMHLRSVSGSNSHRKVVGIRYPWRTEHLIDPVGSPDRHTST